MNDFWSCDMKKVKRATVYQLQENWENSMVNQENEAQNKVETTITKLLKPS